MAEPATLGTIAAVDAVKERTGGVGYLDGPRGGEPSPDDHECLVVHAPTQHPGLGGHHTRPDTMGP